METKINQDKLIESGFTETAEKAALFRAVGLVGVVGFMMAEAREIAKYAVQNSD